MSSSLPIPKIESQELVYQGYFNVHVDLLQSHQGLSMSYTHLDLKVDAAAVLARTKEGKLIINREYRHPTGKWLLSCPGGRIDPGESPIEAGKRELQEEAGYTKGKVTPMGEIFSLPAVTHQIIYYLFIDNVEQTSDPKHEPFELIHTELKTPEELFEEIQQGTPVDGVLCTALFLAKASGLI